jgi:LPXTG-motif cell wall-anchored protein
VRTIRLAALGTVLALLAALFSAASATAASPGIGTSVVQTTIAQLDLGDILSTRILGDDSIATIDKGVLAVPEAATVLRPLTVTSGLLPALNKEIAPVETRSQGAENKTDYSTDLGNVLLPQLIDGSLTPATLSAIVDSAGARAGMIDTLANLVVGGGLVSVDSITANLGANAAKDSSTSTRGVDVGAISGLNLGALLAGLGLPLNALGLPDIEGLTDELGLLGAGNPVAGLLTTLGIGGAVPTDAAGLGTLITGLDTTLDAAVTNLANLQSTITGSLGGVCDATPLLAPVTTLLGLPAGTTCAAALSQLTGDQANAAADLGGLLSGLLSMLDGMELLNVSGIDVGLTSKATDSVGTSVAQVTAAVGDLKVGNLVAVPGVDLSATAAQIVGTVDSVTSQLDSVLGVLGLDGLVNLSLLDTTGTGVTKTPAGYVRSVSNLTGVDLSIVPPTDLAQIVGGLPVVGSSIGGLLAAVPGLPQGVAVPAMPGTTGMESLNTLLSGASAVDALASGARLRLASVGGVAEFLPQSAGATPTGGTLPRTGGNSGLTAFAFAGIIMAMLGLGVRRRVLAPVRVD